MRKPIVTLFLIVLLSLIIAVPALADHGVSPVGGCPDDFHLHHVMDHDHDQDEPHRHVGFDVDRNGDGYLCVKHNDGGAHVHTDNNVPLP